MTDEKPTPNAPELLALEGSFDGEAFRAEMDAVRERLTRAMGIPEEFLRFPEPGTLAATNWVDLYKRGLQMERELDFSPVALLEPDEPQPKG